MTAATNRRNRRAQSRTRRRAGVVRSASARQRRADTTTFTYSDPMFLTAVDGPSGRLATYVYDSESKRRRIYEGAAFTTLVWDGWDYLQWRRPLETHVFHTMNGEIVGESVGGTVRDYLLDPLGSVVATLDSGGIVDQFEYWPYGELVDDLPEGAPVFLWVGGLGYWFDTDDRSYVRHRMLRKDLGSWMQLDPLWPNVGSNGIHYASANPIQVFDPMGLRPWYYNGVYKWLYTGDWNASDEVFEAALEGALGGADCYADCVRDRSVEALALWAAFDLPLPKGLLGWPQLQGSSSVAHATYVCLARRRLVPRVLGPLFRRIKDLSKILQMNPKVRIAGASVLTVAIASYCASLCSGDILSDESDPCCG